MEIDKEYVNTVEVMKSKFIAISAVSASFVAIVLIVGAYISFFDVYALLLSSVFVILPLYFNTYKGCLYFLESFNNLSTRL